jgi:hypothetical protein
MKTIQKKFPAFLIEYAEAPKKDSYQTHNIIMRENNSGKVMFIFDRRYMSVNTFELLKSDDLPKVIEGIKEYKKYMEQRVSELNDILTKVDLEIQYNPLTKGEMCYFTYAGKHYYASRCITFDRGLECMIFPCDENHVVTDWSGLYASYGPTIQESVLDFISKL